MALPAAALDDWLMEMFPGRTLEEMDGIDLARLMRARVAADIRMVEQTRLLFLQKKIEPSPEDWQAIRRHNRLVGVLDIDREEDE